MLKQAVKSVLPANFKNQYVDIKGQIRLRRVPIRVFDSKNLRLFSSVDLARCFSDPEIIKGWEKDHRAISAHYGERELNYGVNPGDRRAIYSLVMYLRPQNVLEIGTHVGTSAIYIAAALRRLRGGGRLTTVDVIDVNDPEQGPWKKVGLSKSPADCAKDLGLSEQIQFRADQ